MAVDTARIAEERAGWARALLMPSSDVALPSSSSAPVRRRRGIWRAERQLRATRAIGAWEKLLLQNAHAGNSVHAERMALDDLPRFAQLLLERNGIDDQIAAVIKRPMTSGHLGEWIAAEILDIELEAPANATAIDGRFRSGPLQDRTVNVKWYLKREGILDMTTSEVLDEYLVLTGPVSAAGSSQGRTRPWCIDAAYLFDARSLRTDLSDRGRSIGTASSIRTELWTQAEIYPDSVNKRLPLTERQIKSLRLFAP